MKLKGYGIADLKMDIKDVILSVFEKYNDKVVFAYLFGTAARGTMSPLSDIDIAVFLPPGTRESYFDTGLSLHADLCRALNRSDVDVVVLNTVTNIMLLDEIVRYGIVVYDKNPDLREDFEIRVLHQAIDFKEQRLAVMGI